jgi:hypothetical protein
MGTADESRPETATMRTDAGPQAESTEPHARAMGGPFIFINSFAIKDGRLDDLKEFLGEFFRVIETNEPRLLAINAYANEQGTEVTFIQVHPDAASLEHHQRVVHQHAGRTLAQFIDATTSFQIYGTPSDVVLTRARQHAASGVPVTVKPHYLGGFTRLPRSPAEHGSRKPMDRTPESRRHEPSAGRQRG